MEIAKYNQMMSYLTRNNLKDKVKFASDLDQPIPKKSIVELEAFNRFNRDNPNPRTKKSNGGELIAEPPKSMQMDTTTSNPLPDYDIRDFRNDAEVFILAYHNNTLPRADIADKLNAFAQKGVDAGTFSMQDAGVMVRRLMGEVKDRAQKQRLRDVVPEGIGRKNFAEAGMADPANNIRKGQELGEGIQQKLKYVNKKGENVFRYVTSAVKDTILKEHKTPKDANIFRKQLIKKYNIGEAAEYKGTKSYQELIKDPDFENFWKARVDKVDVPEVGGLQGKNKFEEGLDKIIKKYKLKPNDYEGIFNKFVEETRISEGIRKGTKYSKGKEKLVSAAFIDNFLKTFEKSYKPNVGTINTSQMEKLLKLPEGSLSKLMANIDKPIPPEKLRFAKSDMMARIRKAAVLKDKLDAAGITYEKFERTPGKGGKDYRFKLDPDKNVAAKKFIQLQNDKDFGFEQKPPTQTQSVKQGITSASKKSDEYKQYGYGRDRNVINNLTVALNNSLKSMNDEELFNFIDKNPKLKNLVTATFDPKSGEIINVPLKDLSMEQIRNSAQFEVDHIRGISTVDYDPATKKILDGLDIEYPKNLYIIPKAINGGVKKSVENYVANFPNETKKIKKINKYFTDNKLTYFNRNTNSYAGYKPSKSAVDVAHLGITKSKELENLITGTYVDEQGIKRVKTNDPAKLVATVKDLQETRGGTKLLASFFGIENFTEGLVEDIKQGKYGKAGFKGLGAASVPLVGYFAQDEYKKGYPVMDILSSAITGFKPTESIARTFVPEEKGGYTDAEKLARAQLQLLNNPPKSSLDMSPVLSLAQKDPEFTGSPNEYLPYLESKREGIESLATGAEKRFQEQIMQPFLKSKAAERGQLMEGIKSVFNPNKFGPVDPNMQLAFQTGGRVGFADGPEDPSKRKFMKIIGGLASLPVFGKFFKVAEKAAPIVDKIKTTDLPGKPEWFDALVNKVIREGTDMTKQFATKEREIVHATKISEDEFVRVHQDLETGSVRVDYDSPFNMGEETVSLEFRPGIADETTRGKPRDEFQATEVEPRYVGGPEDADMEFDGIGGGSSIKMLESDVSNLEKYATGKNPTMKELVDSKKRKDRVKAINEDQLEAAEYISGKYGDGPEPDYDDFIDD